MKPTMQKACSSRAGFTLMEVMIALSIFSVVGYALMSTMAISYGSRKSVEQTASDNRTLRAVSAELTNEFRLTTDSSITIAVLPDQNHQVTLQLPIEIAGATSWGVPGSYLSGANAADADNWSLRYTVDSVVEDGALNRRLVRQVLDAAKVVTSSEVVAEQLRAGNDVWPGFNVAMTGIVWNITISMTGTIGGRVELHVATRN